MRHISIFVVSGKDPLRDTGGYGSYAYNLARILAKKTARENLHLVCLSGNNKSYIRKENVCDVHYVRVPLKFTKTPLLPLHSFFLSKYIEGYIKKRNLKRVTLLCLGPWGLVGAYLKKRMGGRDTTRLFSIYFTTFKHEGRGLLDGVVLSDYGLIRKMKYFVLYNTVIRLLSYFEHKVIKDSDFILVHYHSTREILEKECKVIKNKFVYTPYYSVETFDKEGEYAEEVECKTVSPLGLTVCRQEARKGINYLLHAIKEIVYHYKKDIHFLIIGSGDLLRANMELAKRLKIVDHVRFPGFVRNVEPYLESADIFVLPSIEEGSSAISLQEAMKYGLPIITTDCDGMPEDIIDGFSGLLVPPKNSSRLAEAIVRLLKEPHLRQVLGKNAKELYENKFSLKATENLVQSIFDNL